MFQREILTCFHCWLGLKVRKGLCKPHILWKTTWQNHRISLNHSPCVGVSLMAQPVRNPPAMKETQEKPVQGWEDLLEKEMATHSSILAEKVSWTKEPDGLQSMGSKRLRHEWIWVCTTDSPCMHKVWLEQLTLLESFAQPENCTFKGREGRLPWSPFSSLKPLNPLTSVKNLPSMAGIPTPGSGTKLLYATKPALGNYWARS